MGLVDQDGRYTPPPPLRRTQGSLVGAERLPQTQPNAYDQVDIRDFGSASRLTSEEILTMASVAEARGDSQAALQWKGLATGRQLKDQATQSVATLEKLTAPPQQFPAGQILSGTAGLTPWQQDAGYLAASRKVQDATAKWKASRPGTEEQGSAHAALSAAQGELTTLTEELSAEYVESGQWTEQHQIQYEAEASMREKAAGVAAQVKRVT